MLEVKIDSSITIVKNLTTKRQRSFITPLAFGDIYAMQKKHLPDNTSVRDFAVLNTITGITSGNDNSFYWMFGLKERGFSLLFMEDFLENYNGNTIAKIDVDNLRRENGMTSYPSYNSRFDNDTLICSDLHSSIEAIICILYYYASNNYRLQKCQHCGKWFAVKATRENGNKQYCSRLSPYTGYNTYTCAVAVDKIKDKFNASYKREKKRLERIVRDYPHKTDLQVIHNQFYLKSQEYNAKLKENASPELLKEIDSFFTDPENTRLKWVKYR